MRALTPHSGTEAVPAWGPPNEIKILTCFLGRKNLHLRKIYKCKHLICNIRKDNIILNGANGKNVVLNNIQGILSTPSVQLYKTLSFLGCPRRWQLQNKQI